jgi:4-carboxymuconolactone decarboxylase
MSGRLPALRRADLDDARLELYESLVANEIPWADKSAVRVIDSDGSLLGPFNPLLYSPALGAAQIELFRVEKRATSLSPRVHEVVILTVGAAWGSDYELYAHTAIGRSVGLSDDVIEALAAGLPPTFDSDEEASAHEFTRQLVHRHRVDERTYERAARALGHKGVVDLVLLVGLYLTTCAIINTFEVSAPHTTEA